MYKRVWRYRWRLARDYRNFNYTDDEYDPFVARLLEMRERRDPLIIAAEFRRDIAREKGARYPYTEGSEPWTTEGDWWIRRYRIAMATGEWR